MTNIRISTGSHFVPTGPALFKGSDLNVLVDAINNIDSWSTVVEAVGNGIADDTIAIQSAINQAASNGGGIVWFDPGVYAITSTLLITSDNVMLVGQGGGSGVQVGQGNIRASAATRIVWLGAAPAAGTPMVEFVSPTGTQRKTGGGISNIMIDGNTVCPIGLLLRSWIYGTFDRVTCYACTEDQFLLGVVDYPLLGIGDPADTQYNIFTNCTASTYGGGGWYVTTEARGFRLTGGTVAQAGNTSQNTFFRCNAYMSMGDSYRLENCDTNGFFDCNGSAAFGATSGYDLVLESADQDTGTRASPASDNRFFGGFFGTAICRASKTGKLSSLNNGFYGYKETVQGAVPVLDTGAGGSLDATAIFFTNEAAMPNILSLLDGITAPAAVPGRAQQFVDKADGSCKILFGNGTLKVIATNP